MVVVFIGGGEAGAALGVAESAHATASSTARGNRRTGPERSKCGIADALHLAMTRKQGIGWCVALSAALLSCGGTDTPKFDPDNIQTITGVVVAVDPFVRLERNTRNGVSTVLEDEDGVRTNAVLGPAIWLDKHGIQIDRGDVITVTGSAVKDDKSQLPMLIATEVSDDNLKLALRDEKGRPSWRSIKLDDD